MNDFHKTDQTLERLTDASLRVLADELAPDAVEAWLQDMQDVRNTGERAELLRNLIGSAVPAATRAFEAALTAEDPRLRTIGVRGLASSPVHRARLAALLADSAAEVRDEVAVHGIQAAPTSPMEWVRSKLAGMKHGLRAASHAALQPFVTADRGAVTELLQEFFARQRSSGLRAHYGRATLGARDTSPARCLVRYLSGKPSELESEPWPAERVQPDLWQAAAGTPDKPHVLQVRLERNARLFPERPAHALLVARVDDNAPHEGIPQSDAEGQLVDATWTFEFEVDPDVLQLDATRFEVWLVPTD